MRHSRVCDVKRPKRSTRAKTVFFFPARNWNRAYDYFFSPSRSAHANAMQFNRIQATNGATFIQLSVRLSRVACVAVFRKSAEKEELMRCKSVHFQLPALVCSHMDWSWANCAAETPTASRDWYATLRQRAERESVALQWRSPNSTRRIARRPATATLHGKRFGISNDFI